MAVLRYNLLMLAVGGLTMAAIAPRDQAGAQSGQALAFAEHTCLEYGVTPGTQTFERCVVSAAKAFDRGEPDLAYAEARVAGLPGKGASHLAKHQSRLTTAPAPMV